MRLPPYFRRFSSAPEAARSRPIWTNLYQERDREMSSFDGAPNLTNLSNYGQLEWEKNARLYVRYALVDDIAF
jgi:hypothetical protein